MDKTKALIAALIFAAGAGAGTAVSQPAKSNVTLVNLRLSREDLPDAGSQWRGRACGYDAREGKRVAEPCWLVTLPAIDEKAILDQQVVK